ncbi:MAG: uridine kinase [Myxococcota bacterium]
MTNPHPEGPELYWETDGRLQIRSRFTGESLQDRELIRETYIEREVQVIPNAHLIHLGGASIMDRGREALVPLIGEIVTARREQELVLGVGGGARERHTYALGVDLGLPTGALAAVGWMVCEQNAVMLFHLMAEHRAIEVPYLHYEMLPVYLREGSIPILMSMPTYSLWEETPEQGRIPIHRPDTGAMLLAEVLTTRTCIYVKDVDGLYTENPKKNPRAEFIPNIAVDELLRMNLPDLPIERGVLEILKHARNRREIRIVNGLEPGALTQALEGRDVGTLIHQ